MSLASDLLRLLANSNSIPETSKDVLSAAIRSAKGPCQDLAKAIALDACASKLDELQTIIAHVEQQADTDISTCCGVLLIIAEKGSDLVRRRKFRDIVTRIRPPHWPAMFSELAVEWTKRDPHQELRRLMVAWTGLKQTDDVETFISTEEDIFEQIKAYGVFVGIETPTKQTRINNLLKGLKPALKRELVAHFRLQMLRTENMDLTDIVEAVIELNARSSIVYDWEKSDDNSTKKSPDDGEVKKQTGKQSNFRSNVPPANVPRAPPATPNSENACSGCGRPGHSEERCWKLHPEQRPAPKSSPATPFVSTPNELRAKAAAPVVKPTTRADTAAMRAAASSGDPPTKKAFAAVAAGPSPIDSNVEEIVVRANSGDSVVAMFVDTLSYYSIISKVDALKLNAIVTDFSVPLKVQTLDGTCEITGKTVVSLSFGTTDNTANYTDEFDLTVHVVSTPLTLGCYTPSMILGLSTLMKMGANIRLDRNDIVFTKLDHVVLPLRHRTLTPIPLTTTNVGPSLDRDPIEYEKYVKSLTPEGLRQHIQGRLVNWVPLKAECKLKHGVPPQHHKAYPVPPTEVENMRSMILNLVDEGVLVRTIPGPDSFISPAFLRPKSNGGRRLLVDLKPLNKCQVVADLDLPTNPKESLKLLPQDVEWFAVVDVSNAFHSVEYADDSSRRLHTICVMGEYFEYTRCTQGDENSPRYWFKHLEGLLTAAIGVQYDKWCVPYVDDILIYGSTKESCETRYNLVKMVLLCGNKKISAEQAPSQVVCICGMQFSKDGWKMSDESVNTLRDVISHVPTTLKELRSALGSINYMKSGFGHPGKSLSELTSPFYDVMMIAENSSKKNPSVDIDSCLWNSLIDHYNPRWISFHLFDSSTRFCLTVDASDFHCAGALFSIPSNVEAIDSNCLHSCLLVDCFSKRFSAAERNWPIYERESLAIVESLTRWTKILWQCPLQQVVVFTDSLVALTQWSKLKPPEKLQSRKRWMNWYSELMFYDLENVLFIHIDGTSNHLADLLSRIVVDEFGVFLEEDAPSGPNSLPHCSMLSKRVMSAKPVPSVQLLDTIKQLQFSDLATKEIRDTLTTSSPDSKIASKFHLSDELLIYAIDSDCSGVTDFELKLLIYVPDDKTVRDSIIAYAHQISHSGWRATYARVKEFFYWDSIQSDCKAFVKSCATCSAVRLESTTAITDYVAKKKPFRNSFENLYVDHCHGSGIHSNNICLTIICGFTGFVQFIDCPNETAVATSNAMLQWMGVFGLPKHITSDRGKAFDNEIWRGIMTLLNVEVHFTSVANPRANLAERPHRVLRKMCDVINVEGSDDSNWNAILCLAALSWNTRRSAAITPSSLVFGINVRDPFDLEIAPVSIGDDASPTDFPSYVEWISTHLSHLKSIYRRIKIDEYSDAMDSYPKPDVPLSVGDQVRLPHDSEIGKVVRLGDWSVLVEWPTGTQSWYVPGQLRLIDPSVTPLVPKSDYVIVDHADGFFCARVLDSDSNSTLVEWFDNFGSATYAPLGIDPEWIPTSSIVTFVTLTATNKLSEKSRMQLQRLSIL